MGRPGGPFHFPTVIIGLGAIGQRLADLLAASGVGPLTLVDGDRVEAGNLGRQPLCRAVDLGMPKVEVARRSLIRRHPSLRVVSHDRFITDEDARLLKGAATVCDCTDDLHARYRIDSMCGSLGIPLVSGAVHGREGQVVLLHAFRPDGSRGPALRDLFSGRPNGAQDGCDMHVVPAAVLDEVAARMHAKIMALARGEEALPGVLTMIGEDAAFDILPA